MSDTDCFKRLFLILLLVSSLTTSPNAAEIPERDSSLPEPVAVEIIHPTAPGGMTYADAAAAALAVQENHTPLHYKDITAQALTAGWLTPKGSKPEISLYAAISNEIKRQQERGEELRFFKASRGYFGLTVWQPEAALHSTPFLPEKQLKNS